MLQNRRTYSVAYIYHAHFVFMEVSGGIYKIVKDRTAASTGKYVPTDTVIEALNSDRRVVISQSAMEYAIHANFEIPVAESTNSEMRGLLEDA